MRLPIVIILTLAVSTVAASHEPCRQQDPADLALGTPDGIYYVVNDPCQPECAFSVWVYKEANGEPGLQRPPAVIDDVGHPCRSDELIL